MMTTIQTPIDTVDVLMWLRRRDALCGLPYSLAEGAWFLSEVRKAKAYKLLGLTWNRFCHEWLRIGYAKADQITRNYEEFGATYFVLAQITRIWASIGGSATPSPATSCITMVWRFPSLPGIAAGWRRPSKTCCEGRSTSSVTQRASKMRHKISGDLCNH